VYNEVARRLLLKQEVSEISQAMCIPEDALKALMRKPAFKEMLAQLQAKVYQSVDASLASDARNLREELSQAAFSSFDRLNTLLKTAASEAVVVNIAQDLLDRAGYGKTSKIIEERVIKIDPLEAEILTAALAREKEGREHLNTRSVDELLSSGKNVPIGKHAVTEPGKPT
jgi:hypothetical protein